MGGEPGIISQYIKGRKPGRLIHLSIGTEKQNDKVAKRAYLRFLRDVLEPEEYRQAQKMSYEEMKGAYHKELAEHKDAPLIVLSDHTFGLIHEIVVGHLFFSTKLSVLCLISNGRSSL